MRWYVDPAWRRSEWAHSPFLYPFWGIALSSRTPYQRALFERHMFDTSQYQLTDKPEDADIVFMPYAHNMVLKREPELYTACLEKAREIGKPLLVDGIGDIEHPIRDKNVFVIRYGGYRFENVGNELIIPPFADDLLEIFCNGQLQLRDKSPKPSVSFAGWAKLTPMQTLRTVIKESPYRLYGIFDSRYRAYTKGVLVRAQAIKILRRSPSIMLNTIVRSGYSGHVTTADASSDELRRQYVENILGSDYALDIRGDANASTRLFEVLSLGRIPVIVDTERNFPFMSDVNYDEFSFKIDFRDINSLPERIAQLNTRISNEDFKQMQRKAREAYVRYFRVDALIKHVVAQLRQRSR